MFWQKQRCIKCGFFCIKSQHQKFVGESSGLSALFRDKVYEPVTEYNVINHKQRTKISGLGNELKNIYCYRQEFGFVNDLQNAINKDNLQKISNLVENKHKCKYYFRYVPGYEPQKHMSMWEDDKREYSRRNWKLLFLFLGTVIGAALTEIVTIIVNYLVGK
jgi:hypothetical protein